MKLKFTILFILWPIICLGADLSYDIDPGGTGDYTSLNAWEAAQDQDLTDGGGDTMTANCFSSNGADDTAQCTINGWTTGASNWIKIIGTDFPSDGILDETEYLLFNDNANSACLYIQESHVYVHKIQIRMDNDGGGNRFAIYQDNCTDIEYDSCILYSDNTGGSGGGRGIILNNSNAEATMYNCTISGFINSSDTTYSGIWTNLGSDLKVYNCTIYDCYTGIEDDAGVMTVRNTIIADCTDDEAGLDANDAQYCCSDDTITGTGNVQPSSSNWANELNDRANQDFTIVSGGNCENGGTDDPGSGLYSDDIIDVSRVSTWDIGAYELEASIGGQVIIIY